MAINTDFLMENSNRITTSSAIQGKGVEEMGMDDFFNLLVAQMTNQDMMNPADNTQMVAQMAQFSALQAMNTVAEYQQSTNALSYVGKNVTIAHVTEAGDMVSITGDVEKVTFYDGKPQVYVNGKAYDLYTVMQVNSSSGSSAIGSALNSAASYIGKYVTLTAERKNGDPYDLSGKVTSVTVKGGKAHVILDGGDESYAVDSITDVSTAPIEQKQNLSEAASYIGKYVTVAVDDGNGGTVSRSGYVEDVEMRDGSAFITLRDGSVHQLSSVTRVRNTDPGEENPIPDAPENEEV